MPLKKSSVRCESCINYQFDEDLDSYVCLVNLDEDELYHFFTESNYSCPYYRINDDYAIVRKQN
ncbi:MAG: DUF6472 family protein [Hominimerdicola sp.]